MARVFTSDGSHWYDNEGKPQHDADLRVARLKGLFSSVTTIDKGAFPNPALDSWKTGELLDCASSNTKQPHESEDDYAKRIYELSLQNAKTAAEFGKQIHGAIEEYPQLPLDPALMPWFDKFTIWWQSNVGESIASEQVVVDKEIGVAGTLDRIVTMKDGRRAIVDFKTQNVKKGKPNYYDSWKRQLAFYAVCDSKNRGAMPEIPDCISLVIDSNEGGKIYDHLWDRAEIVEAYKDFLAGAWLWFRSRDYWPVDRWEPTFSTPIPSYY